MNSLIGFSCPNCGSNGQRFAALSSLNRVVRANCSNCGTKITSEIAGGKYLLLLLYAHIVLVVIAVPLILALAGKEWGFAIAAAFLFVIFVFPPAMMLHARSAAIAGLGKEAMRVGRQ
jgi:uncharacterized protein (DUF983 family)